MWFSFTINGRGDQVVLSANRARQGTMWHNNATGYTNGSSCIQTGKVYRLELDTLLSNRKGSMLTMSRVVVACICVPQWKRK